MMAGLTTGLGVCMITLVRFDYQPAHIIIGAACLWISSSLCLALLTRNIIDINPVLSHLYSRLGQTDLDGQLLPGEDVRVVGPAERLLQLLQLKAGEGCAVSALLAHLGHRVLLSHPNLAAGVRARRSTGAARSQNLRRGPTTAPDAAHGPRLRSAGVQVLLPLHLLPLVLPLLPGRLAQPHDVGDEEGPVRVAELASREVCRLVELTVVACIGPSRHHKTALHASLRGHS